MTTVMSARAHVSLLAVVVVWAGSFSVIKQLLDDGVAAGDIAILRYLFLGVGRLEEPFARCGPDPTPDDLGCESYPPCGA